MSNTVAAINNATQTLTNANETVVATAPSLTYDVPNPYVGGEHSGAGSGVAIRGVINIDAVGTTGNQATIRVRQGGLTGPVVGVSVTQVVTAGNTYSVPFCAIDTSRYAAAGGVYVATLQINGATANTTVSPTYIEVTGV